MNTEIEIGKKYKIAPYILSFGSFSERPVKVVNIYASTNGDIVRYKYRLSLFKYYKNVHIDDFRRMILEEKR